MKEIIARAEALDGGITQMALLQQAVRLADSVNNVGMGLRARLKLTRSALTEGFTDVALVAFSWCLAQVDRNPDQWAPMNYDFCWRYKSLIWNLPQYPGVTRDQILGALDDFGRKLDRAGYSRRAEVFLRWMTAWGMAARAAAEAHYVEWLKHPNGYFNGRGDDINFCSVCDTTFRVNFLLWLDREEEALDLADPILRGARRCFGNKPSRLSRALCAVVRAGRAAEAARKYLEYAREKPYLIPLCHQLDYLLLIGDLSRALERFQSHLAWALTVHAPSDRFFFLCAGRRIMKRLAVNGTVSIRLPRILADSGAVKGSKPIHLCEWLDAQCQELAAQFDRRNGNDHYGHHLREGKQHARRD
jgi:hypothetical protein